MTRQEIIKDLIVRQSAYDTAQNVPVSHSLLAFIIRELEAEKQPETLSRRDEIASRAMEGILASQTEMRASGLNNEPNGSIFLAKEALMMADCLIKELDKGKEE